MKPFYRDNLVNGPYTLERGRLTFRTKGSLLGADAARALRSGNSLTVSIYTDAGLKEITGQVLSADLKRGTPPTEWEVRMKIQLERRVQ
jgi:hypothetical protein